MKILKTPLENAFVIEPEPIVDERGEFSRIFCKHELEKIGHHKEIVQINQSLTKSKGAVRGMHFQYPPRSEIKLVKCLFGSVFDVIIDLRHNSSTFLQWYGTVLSSDNMKMMYMPEGFAHGFQTLERDSQLVYLHTEFYSPEHESGIRYDDPLVNISWPLKVTEISDRDKNHPLLSHKFSGIILS